METSQEPAGSETPKWIEWFGWYGTFAILGAYLMLTENVIEEEGWVYRTLNLTGAIGVGLLCLKRRTWQAFWLEAAWAAIAVLSFF